MKVTCNAKDLTNAFQIAASVCPSRTTIEVLRSLLFKFTTNSGELIGSDTEIGIRCDVPNMSASQAGSVLLNVSKVFPILKEATGETITMNITEKSIEISSGTSRFRLQIQDASDYPEVGQFTDESYYSVPAGILSLMIKQTVFATDDLGTSHQLGGVKVEFEDGHAIFCSTDSRRIAVSEYPCTAVGSPPVLENDVMIPAKALSVVDKCLSGTSPVSISLHSNQVSIRADGVVLIAKTLIGRFPKYKKQFLAEPKFQATVVAGPFASAVRQSMIIRNAESSGVAFMFADNSLTLDSQASNIGDSTMQLPIQYTGEPMTVKLDPQYVAEFLKALQPTDSIIVNLVDEEANIVFQCESYRYLVCPFYKD